MPRKDNGPQAKAYFEEDWSEENQARCAGYRWLEYGICGETYTCLVRCDPFPIHPHRERVMVDGHGRTRVPLYGFLADLATEDEAKRNIGYRQKRATKRMEHGQEGVKGMLREFKKAAEGERMPKRGTVLKPTFSPSGSVPF